MAYKGKAEFFHQSGGKPRLAIALVEKCSRK